VQAVARWRRLKALLADALALPAPQRLAHVQRAAADTAEARELLGLVAAAGAEDSLLDRGAQGWLDDVQSARQETQASPADAAVHRQVGAYELLGWIASGGMGQVYRARRRAEPPGDAPGPVVALKLMRQGVADEHFSRRFDAERRALARLSHPNLARLLDAGVHTSAGGDLPYLVMEFVDGEPIDHHCSRLGLRVDQVLALFRSLCHAVQHAHRQGMVHRDIKPANVLVTAEGVVKLVDFGIAKQVGHQTTAATTATAAPMRLMTLAFASPEQVRGQPVTVASDLYSLGVLLHHLLTGCSPYRGVAPGDDLALRNAVCRQRPRRPSRLVDGARRGALAGDLDRVLLACLHKQPARRPASAAVLARDLHRVQQGRPLRREAWRRAARRRPGVLLCGLAAAAVALAAGWQQHQQRETAARHRAEALRLVQDDMRHADAGEEPGDPAGLRRAVAALQADEAPGNGAAWPAERALALAGGHTRLSAALWNEGHRAEALDQARQAVAAARGAAAAGVAPAARQRALAAALLALADALPAADAAAARRAALDEARLLAQGQLQAHPGEAAPQALLAQVDASLGRYYLDGASVEQDAAGRAAAALAASVDRYDGLAAGRSAALRWTAQAADARLALAEAWLRAGRPADALAMVRRALEDSRAMATGAAGRFLPRHAAGALAAELAQLARRAGDAGLAVSAAETALAMLVAANGAAGTGGANAPPHPRDRLIHARAHQALGQALVERSLADARGAAAAAHPSADWQRACSAYRQALALLQPLAPRWPGDRWVPDGAAVFEMRLFLRACPDG